MLNRPGADRLGDLIIIISGTIIPNREMVLRLDSPVDKRELQIYIIQIVYAFGPNGKFAGVGMQDGYEREGKGQTKEKRMNVSSGRKVKCPYSRRNNIVRLRSSFARFVIKLHCIYQGWPVRRYCEPPNVLINMEEPI